MGEVSEWVGVVCSYSSILCLYCQQVYIETKCYELLVLFYCLIQSFSAEIIIIIAKLTPEEDFGKKSKRWVKL